MNGYHDFEISLGFTGCPYQRFKKADFITLKNENVHIPHLMITWGGPQDNLQFFWFKGEMERSGDKSEPDLVVSSECQTDS